MPYPKLSIFRAAKLRQFSAALITALTVGAGAAHAAEPLKTCFLYNLPIGESGWIYQRELARKELVAALGDKITTQYVENIAEGPDGERVLRNFVKDGCKLIFAPSFGLMEQVMKVARQSPDVIFMNGSGYKTAANVGVYNARYYEGRYLEGVLAGHMSKSGIAGYVGSFPIPEVLQGLNAFTLGMRSVNPKASVKLIWANTWYDPGKERDAAGTLIKLGADVLAYHTSGVSIVTGAEDKGIYTLGYYSDVRKFGPKTNLTSIMQTWGPFYIKTVEDVLAKRWKPANTLGGLREGMIKMAPLNDAVPPAVREKLQEAERAIIDGKLHPFAGPIVDQEGKERVASGKVMSDEELNGMKFLVDGIEGRSPKH
jgi:simple sugar transport system substrate-binding protein